MKLKIGIKEVKEETRELTIEEQCMLRVAYTHYGGCIDDDCRKAAKDRLAEIGFVQYVDQQKTRGLFRNTTPERLATEIETIAWHCTQIWKLCDMIDVECCDNCPKRGGCLARDEWVKAKALLEGKEVILELVDE